MAEVASPDEGEALRKQFLAERAHYLILSRAGKPVYHSTGTEEVVSSYMAVLQAIVSLFEPSTELKHFHAGGGTEFVFLVRKPLILVAIDKLGRSEEQLRQHLELLHAQVLSTLTQMQLEKAFDAKANLDLRPMLGGTEVFLGALVKDMVDSRPWSWLGALESLDLPSKAREQLHTSLLEARTPALLYGLVVSDGRFAGVVRPRRHSLHPPDLHLVFSMLFNTQAFVEGEHWAPICLPRFNANGFLYAYINFVAPETAIVLISPDRNAFFEMQEIHLKIVNHLRTTPGVLEALADAIARGRLSTVRDLRVPLVTEFVYKSYSHVQYVGTDLCDDTALQFAQLQAHMKKHKLRISYKASNEDICMGWHTQAFEVYCKVNTTSVDDMGDAVRRLVVWLRRHERRLFITDGAIF